MNIIKKRLIKMAAKESYDLVDDIFVDAGSYNLNGTEGDSPENLKILKSLGILSQKNGDNIVKIKAHTPITHCEIYGPAGGNPYIEFNLKGNKFSGDFYLDSEEERDSEGNVKYKLFR